jgi:hypothetical protein
MLARRLFALGAHLLGQRELRRHVAVLPVLLIQLQRDRQVDRHHVRVGRPALVVHELHTPVGALVALRNVGVGTRHLFLLSHQG